MVEKSEERRKVSFSEEDACSLLQRYEPTTVLTLLQELEYHTDLKIDWNELVKKSSTGVTNAREYQMLWRHLAYRDDLPHRFEDGAQPLDDDSDTECELEAVPAPINESLTEAEACVKVMINSGMQSESNILNGSMIEAPLTINIPIGHFSRDSSENLQPSCSTQGKNIIVPVTVQKFPLPSVPSTGNLGTNGSNSGNNISSKRKRKWSEEEDRWLMAAVEKWGEGNWAVIISKGEYDWGGRQSSHLSQRWATLRKKNTNLSIGKNSSEPNLTEAQMAARHAVSLALDPPVKSHKANGTPGHDSTGQANVVAAGTHITPPLDAVSSPQATEAKSGGHIVCTGGSSFNSLMPASGVAQSETHPNQRCTHASQTTTGVSSHTKASSPAVPKSEPKNECITLTKEFPLKQEVNEVKNSGGREVRILGCAPKEQVRGDEFNRRQVAVTENRSLNLEKTE